MPHNADIAVLGCGGWGRNIVRTMNQLGRLAAVADPSPAGQNAARDVAPGVNVVAEPSAAISDPSIKGVMIATPAETHYDMACEAIAAGKDVFVEKPLTIDVDEARDLVARAQAADRILMVG